jgi:hypothetical protein
MSAPRFTHNAAFDYLRLLDGRISARPWLKATFIASAAADLYTP